MYEATRLAIERNLKDVLFTTLFTTQIKGLEIFQSLIIETTLTIPIDPGTYDYIMEPDEGKIWYFGYLEQATSTNTSAEIYMTSITGGGEAQLLSISKNTTGSKDFKLDYGSSGRCIKLRIRFTNDGTDTENQTLTLRGIEVELP